MASPSLLDMDGVMPTPTPTPTLILAGVALSGEMDDDSETMSEPVKEFKFNTVNLPLPLDIVEIEVLALAPVSPPEVFCVDGTSLKSTPLNERVMAFDADASACAGADGGP